MSPSAILVRVGAAVQSAKGLSEVEYKSEGVVINRYILSQSHHWSHGSKTSVLITGEHDNNNSTNGKIDKGWIDINDKIC